MIKCLIEDELTLNNHSLEEKRSMTESIAIRKLQVRFENVGVGE